MLLFACEPTGMLCHEVSAYVSFDVTSGRHVAGSPELRLDSAAHTVTVRIAGSIIGVYVMGVR